MAPRKKVERTLLVDHDIVVFRYASTCELIAHWSPTVSTKILQIEQAKYGIMQFIDALMTRCSCTKVKLFLTGNFNFRYAVLPTYKHNRVEKEKPELLPILREWSEQEYEVVMAKGFEADDLLGIYGSKDPDTTVVATIDKDLKSVPCKLYLWHRDTLEMISEFDADYQFFYQVLIGDSTDGYSGCPQCGPVAAEALLTLTPRKDWWSAIVAKYQEAIDKALMLQSWAKDGPPGKQKMPKRDWWTSVIEAYKAVGESVEAYALQQARVARICRWEDHDPQRMEVIYWTPKRT